MCLTRECVRADARQQQRLRLRLESRARKHTHTRCATCVLACCLALLLLCCCGRDPPLRSRTGEQSRICLHRLRRRGPQHAIRGQEMVIQMREADEESGGRQTDSLSQAGECEWQAREKS